MRHAFLWLAGGRGTALVAALVIPLAMAGQAAAGVSAAASHGRQASTTAGAAVARLTILDGNLPAAMVGRPYSYRFRVGGGGTAFWVPVGGVPLGLALDPETGILSGVPEE